MFEPNQIICGDCVKDGIMRRYPNNSFDGIVTDPPYGLGFMGKDWDTFTKDGLKRLHEDHSFAGNKRLKEKSAYTTRATAAGSYDFSRNAEYQEWCRIWSAEALRIAKPGAFLLCFGGTRTSHRLTCGLEDAGWQIRDCMMWLYGSGFPKSHNISKAIDKAKGAKREVVGDNPNNRPNCAGKQTRSMAAPITVQPITAPTTPLAKLWDGYGTALKPAWEPIVVAMKPLDGTFAANAEKWGVAGLNIDGGRIGTSKEDNEILEAKSSKNPTGVKSAFGGGIASRPNPQGRWPANLILDEEVAAMLDEQTRGVGNTKPHNITSKVNKYEGYGSITKKHGEIVNYNEPNAKGASRFFYCAKASRAEHNAGLDCDPQITDDGRKKKIDNAYLRGKTLRQNNHPTVKPLALMEYLCTLLKPPTEHPILLDPFCGSGTTLMAAINTGWDYVGIEKEKEYCEIAKKRVAYTKEQRQGQMALWKGD